MRNAILIFLAVLVLVVGGIGLFYLWGLSGHTYYSGCIVLPTGEDYSNFKMAFTSPHVALLSAAVLASDPPIIVSFEAEVDNFDYPFPYGIKSIKGYFSKGRGGLFSLWLDGIGILLISAAILSFIKVRGR